MCIAQLARKDISQAALLTAFLSDGDAEALATSEATLLDARVALHRVTGRSSDQLTLQDLGEGRTRLVTESLCDSFGARDGWLASGMEGGVNDGYAKQDGLLAGVDA